MRETVIFRDEQFGVTASDIEVIKYSSLLLSAGTPSRIPETAGSAKANTLIHHVFSCTYISVIKFS